MKRLLAELKEYKAPSIKAPLFMIGEVGLELSLPFLMAYIIDNGVTKGGHEDSRDHGTAHAGSGVPVADLRRAVCQICIIRFGWFCQEPAPRDV